MERFQHDHPNDPASDLQLIGYYWFKRDYDKVFAAIERLDKSLGGDPYLDAMKARILFEMKKFKEARDSAEKAIKEDPKQPLAYLVRAAVSAQEKNHKDALVWLKKLVEATGAKLNLETDVRFADFVKSPQFQELNKWIADRKK